MASVADASVGLVFSTDLSNLRSSSLSPTDHCIDLLFLGAESPRAHPSVSFVDCPSPFDNSASSDLEVSSFTTFSGPFLERVIVHADADSPVVPVGSSVSNVDRPAGPAGSVASQPPGLRGPARGNSAGQRGQPRHQGHRFANRSAVETDRVDRLFSRSSVRHPSPSPDNRRSYSGRGRGGGVHFSLPSRRPVNQPSVFDSARRSSSRSISRSPDIVPARPTASAQRRDSSAKLIDFDSQSVQDQSIEDLWSPARIFSKCRTSLWGTLTIAGVILLITILIVVAIITHH